MGLGGGTFSDKPAFYGSEVKDFASIAPWSTVQEAVDCVGAREGMFVTIGLSTLNNPNIHLNGYVLAGGDVVVVTISNMQSSVSVNLASGILYVKASFF
jgi:hypothetical protein